VVDALGRQTFTLGSHGETTSNTWGSACCGPLSQTAADGTVTTFDYDPLGRLSESIALGADGTVATGIRTRRTYDPANRELTEELVSGDESLSLFTSRASYDLMGRRLWQVDAAGVGRAYEEDEASRTSTTHAIYRAPNGDIFTNSTTVSTRRLDGSPSSTVRDGVLVQAANHGVNSDGTTWNLTAQGPLDTDCPWSRSTSDFLGRPIVEERPGYGGALLVTSNYYNTAGQLIRTQVSSFEFPVSQNLFTYDSLGNRLLIAQDLDFDGIIDLAGPDRVTGSDTSYESDSSDDYWQVTRSWTYPHDASATPLTNAISRTRLTGLGPNSEFGLLTSESCSLDHLGNTTASRTYLDRAARTVTQVTDTPDSVLDARQVSVNGLALRSVSPTGVTNSYAYDALRRQIALTDGRGNTSRTHYDANGRVDWIADAAGSTNRFGYDALGRRIHVSDALGQQIHTAYDREGRTIATWGATYPVAYEYDASGRMTAMATTRDNDADFATLAAELAGGTSLVSLASPMSLDLTTWLYDQPTGLLTNRLYADGRGPFYTYTPDGKLATRTWAGARRDHHLRLRPLRLAHQHPLLRLHPGCLLPVRPPRAANLSDCCRNLDKHLCL
jgi:YD repeat-containing protein